MHNASIDGCFYATKCNSIAGLTNKYLNMKLYGNVINSSTLTLVVVAVAVVMINVVVVVVLVVMVAV